MEHAQKELLTVLLGRVQFRGLISKATYQNAVDSVHSATNLPVLLQYPGSRAEGGEP